MEFIPFINNLRDVWKYLKPLNTEDCWKLEKPTSMDILEVTTNLINLQKYIIYYHNTRNNNNITRKVATADDKDWD